MLVFIALSLEISFGYLFNLGMLLDILSGNIHSSSVENPMWLGINDVSFSNQRRIKDVQRVSLMWEKGEIVSSLPGMFFGCSLLCSTVCLGIFFYRESCVFTSEGFGFMANMKRKRLFVKTSCRL